MTPKEKASNLVEIFWTEVEDNNYETRKMSFNQAKQCTLFAVNEIINEFLFDDSDYSNRRYKFYIEVKEQIELL